MKIKIEVEVDTDRFEDKERVEKILELLENLREQLNGSS